MPRKPRKPSKPTKPKQPAARRTPAQARLETSASAYRAILDSTADGILVVDGQGKIVSYNRKFQDLWRIPEAVMATGNDDLALATVLDQLTDPQAFLDKVRALYGSPDAESFDVLDFKDGRVFERYSQPQREGGEVMGRVWSFRDVTERRRVEAALLESEARYRLVSDNVVDVVFTTDLELHVTYVSPSIERVTGYTVKELKRLPLDRLFTPASVEVARRNLAEALAENAARGRVGGRTMEVEVVRKDGLTLWAEFKISFLRDSNSVLHGILGVARDISERRRTEAALRSVVVGTARAIGDEFFRTLTQHLAMALEARCAVVGELIEPECTRVRTLAVWVGDRFVDNVEYNLAGAPCEHIVTDDRLTVYPERLRQLFPDDPFLVRLRAESYVGLALRDSAGRTLGNLLVIHDGPMRRLSLAESLLPVFATRAAAELERRRTEQRLSLQSTVMESAANAIAVTDPTGTIEWTNPAFSRLTGYTPKEALGKSTRILNSGKQPKAFYEQLWRTIQAGTVWRGEMINRRKDGSLYTERMTITPVMDTGSGGTAAIRHYVAVKEDVTAVKQMEDQLRRAQRMEAVGRLAGGVAHDFNNLLQAMLGITQLSRLHGEDLATSQERMQELEELLRRGAQLTQQLLLFSRREEIKAEPVDLNQVIRDTAKLLRRLLGADVTLDLELSPEALPVMADPGQISQVWMNLAVNATDAMPDGGTLTVRSGRRGDGDVWFSVTDTGHGIPDDIRDHIFEPFFTTKGDRRGTGLGLAVVHGIVTQHGGEVEVASTVGKGTTFRVMLPRRAEEGNAATAEPAQAAALPHGNGERVLLVEDNDSVRRAFERLLIRLGYEVTAAGSAEEADLLPVSQPFALLLTDMVLPGLSGAGLAAQLRERWPELKVVFMSGYTEDEALRKRAAEGEVRFLQKPVDLGTLAREVYNALSEGRS